MILENELKRNLKKRYKNMLSRCFDKNNKDYNRYGGRGISVCDIWVTNYDEFEKWSVSNGFYIGLEIDRIDNDGNYEPFNCQWVTHSENMKIGKRGKQSNNSSGYVGIHYDVKKSSWRAQINFDGKRKTIGNYKKIEDAVKSRIDKEIELFGEQKTNFHLIKSEGER